jgi:hypothetical protein
LEGRGKPGDEENGSNAGSNEGAGRFTPAVEGKLGWAFILLGDESIMTDIYHHSPRELQTFRPAARKSAFHATESTSDTGPIEENVRVFGSKNTSSLFS